MNQMSFVIAAYAVTLLGVAGLIAWAYTSMRKAEAAADRLRQ